MCERTFQNEKVIQLLNEVGKARPFSCIKGTEEELFSTIYTFT